MTGICSLVLENEIVGAAELESTAAVSASN